MTLMESDPRSIEASLAKLSRGRERFIPSKTIRSMIRHGHFDQLERFTVDGVQTISVEGQNIYRLGRIAWVVLGWAMAITGAVGVAIAVLAGGRA